MKKTKTIFITLSLITLFLLTGCSEKEVVTIYSSTEDFNNEHLLENLTKKFPDINVDLQYNSTGESIARLQAEGMDSPCDIVYGLEPGPFLEIQDMLVDVSSYDTGLYIDEYKDYNPYFLINQEFSNVIIVNENLMEDLNLPYPKSYEDLLDPIYKNHIIFPNPKLSSSGFALVNQMFDLYGEEKAIEYFDKLDENIREYVSSGSTTCKDVGKGEVAIGFAVTYSTLQEMDKGAPLKIISPIEGSPRTINGIGLTKKGNNSESAKIIFKYMAEEFLLENNQKFFCEKVFKDHIVDEPRLPENMSYYKVLPYTMESKKQLLEKWKY